MKKLLIHLSFLTLVLVTGMIGVANSAYAANSTWSDLTSWFKAKSLPPKPASAASQPTIPAALTISPTPIIEPAAQPVVLASSAVSPAAQPAIAPAAPDTSLHWKITDLPEVAIAQTHYANINLNDYVLTKMNKNHLLYAFTPGKANPDWASLEANGILHISPDKISPEDVDTTQVIAVTVSGGGQFSPTEIAIKVTANQQLPAPQWAPNVTLRDALPNQPYFISLAPAVNTNNLRDNDQLIFQLVSSSVSWLEIGDNGFSLTAKKIPEDAANKYYEVILRVTSKMSGKSNDFNGRLYVNPIPQPLQWQPAPAAAINKMYTLDLANYVQSNIKNDRFTFQVDLATLPNWLSIQNNRILTGIPQEAQWVGHAQEITVTATSQISGMTGKHTVLIAVHPDQRLTPQWKKDFFTHPITGESFRSDDLTTVLENLYPHDQISFEYVSGPAWLGFNSLCHCLASQGLVPENAAGKPVTIKLRARSKASGQSIDYVQSVMVYTGIPQWVKTALPEVTIAQKNALEIPMNEYVQDDISGDSFHYSLDRFHSPSWISLNKKEGRTYLVVDPAAISANEASTAQTVRLLATSQSTHKTSVQLLTINVKPNPSLPKPVWKGASSSIVTEGMAHAMDLNQSIQGSLPGDRLTVKLGEDSPQWLSIQNNRLTGIPPHSQVGGPYLVTFIVHSQAANTNTVLQTQITVQLITTDGNNMETHQFYDNHVSIVVRGLKKNHKYRLAAVKGSHFDYGPFYSPHAVKTAEDWNGNPFYAVNKDQIVETGAEGVVSIIYYTLPGSPAPQFQSVTLR